MKVDNRPEEKPKRLYFKTFMQMVRNSVGTQMFRSFYVQTSDRGEFDGLDDGDKSCAFYVSSVLTLMGKVKGPHGTVASTIKDLEESGWQKVDGEPEPGDVIVWEPVEFEDGTMRHIGFYLGDNRAVSTSRTEKAVFEHDLNFGNERRTVEQVLRLNNWDDEIKEA